MWVRGQVVFWVVGNPWQKEESLPRGGATEVWRLVPPPSPAKALPLTSGLTHSVWEGLSATKARTQARLNKQIDWDDVNNIESSDLRTKYVSPFLWVFSVSQ